MGRRTPGPPPLHVDTQPVLRRVVLLQALGNGSAGLALMFGAPGSSATFALMSQILPLTAWGVVLLVAAVAQATGNLHLVPAGHAIGTAAWLFVAGAAVTGLAQGTSTSGAGSVLLAGLLVGWAGLHLNGLVFRRAEQLAVRREARGE